MWHVWETRENTQCLWGNPKKRDQLRDLYVNGRIILKSIKVGGRGLDSSGSGQVQVASSCKHGNNLSGFIKGRKFLDQLRNYQLLKKVSASWTQLNKRRDTRAVYHSCIAQLQIIVCLKQRLKVTEILQRNTSNKVHAPLYLLPQFTTFGSYGNESYTKAPISFALYVSSHVTIRESIFMKSNNREFH